MADKKLTNEDLLQVSGGTWTPGELRTTLVNTNCDLYGDIDHDENGDNIPGKKIGSLSRGESVTILLDPRFPYAHVKTMTGTEGYVLNSNLNRPNQPL